MTLRSAFGVQWRLLAIMLLSLLARGEARAGTVGAPVPAGQSQPAMGTLAALDYKNGFRDAAFGGTLASLGVTVLVEDQGSFKFYMRPGEDLRLGATVPVNSITYGFYKGRLATVLLDAKGAATRDALLLALGSAYGAPAQDSRDPANLYAWWMGSRVRLSLRWQPATESVQVNFSGMEIMQEVKRDLAGGL